MRRKWVPILRKVSWFHRPWSGQCRPSLDHRGHGIERGENGPRDLDYGLRIYEDGLKFGDPLLAAKDPGRRDSYHGPGVGDPGMGNEDHGCKALWKKVPVTNFFMVRPNAEPPNFCAVFRIHVKAWNRVIPSGRDCGSFLAVAVFPNHGNFVA